MATQSHEPQDVKAELKKVIDGNVDKEKLKAKFDLSNFEPNAVLRGMQLTLVGAHRALQNPALFTSDHYRQAAIAVAVGIAIRLLVSLPVLGVRLVLWTISLFYSLDRVQWDDSVINGLHFIEEYVLQVPFFLMTLMRYVDPTLDNLFMRSLEWVDITYVQKHKSENPDTLRDMYYPNLKSYEAAKKQREPSQGAKKPLMAFLMRFVRKGGISLAVFSLSYVPYIGRFVLPAASFYTFNKAVGAGPATVIFGTGVFLPRRYLVVFLQTYFSSRSLMRELLEPYFARVHFDKAQKKRWFRSREGVLFGFGLGFYWLVKVPLVGVLIYGIAEASTAYLITKITEPPPPVSEAQKFVEAEQEWKNKHEFLNLSLTNLDLVRTEKTASE
ncbi:uncharacterized protein F5Z01DRAFT_262038 [Emericellopsis atlantica]|uniref:Transmembrane protein UsgS n=1 Tax=Emericellopsis atlantica TaxID=2614577 RepID=A0A9P8CM63_9HYPO|nr:uncharacterized protein F5Z01DRAFT_262038 [Emericellopsis atlantica]KAG9251700.1 hypothetical protein F5Z01DRAFT_262038 [Emericellopsis atlantica]